MASQIDGSYIKVSVKENGRGGSQKWSLSADQDGEWTLQDLLTFCKQSLITIASDALKEEQYKGFDKNPLTLVDRKPSKDINSVSPLGQIQFISRQDIGEIILYTYQAVWDRSPVLTGEYKDSNILFYNGSVVATNLQDVKAWVKDRSFNDSDKIRIVNLAPYARKLELNGVTDAGSSRKWGKPGKAYYKSSHFNDKGQVRKPNGVYALATAAVRRKYGRNVSVKNELVLGSTMGLAGPGRVRKTGSKNGAKLGGVGTPYVYPSILLYVFDSSGPDT